MRRARHIEPDPPDDDPDDEPDALRGRLAEAHRSVNRAAGRLPGAAVVNARWLLDTLREIVDAAESLDIGSVVFLRGVLDDFLPTTLRTYLALGTPQPEQTGALLDQIDTLQRSAAKERRDAMTRKAHEFAIQASFLTTKFSGSDLDLE